MPKEQNQTEQGLWQIVVVSPDTPPLVLNEDASQFILELQDGLVNLSLRSPQTGQTISLSRITPDTVIVLKVSQLKL